MPNFLNFKSLLTYSFGLRTLGGSETKSLAKLVPSSNALNFNSFLIVKLFFLPNTFIVIILFSFLDL